MRIFQPTYSENGQQKRSKTYHVEFRDHLNRRQRVTAFREEKRTRGLVTRLEQLIAHKTTGTPLPSDFGRWLDTVPDVTRRKLVEVGLLDAGMVANGLPLLSHLVQPDDWDSLTDEERAKRLPSYETVLRAKGDTTEHIKTTINRIKRLLVDCGFATWPQLAAPSAPSVIQVYLGGRRAQGDIVGTTFNYYVRDVKAFARWLYDQGRAPGVALEKLSGVDNAEVDRTERRALSTEEMVWLLKAAKVRPTRLNISGDDRALQYQFAFETGLRPGQMRSLTVKDFDLDSDPATVTTAAKFVKRRAKHVQVLTPTMATRLREAFASKMPSAPAFTFASRYSLAAMLRRDMALGRKLWIKEGKTAKERADREASDFLAATDHQGAWSCFYSLRHSHGTALADLGASEKDIAASMHHTNRKTTARYLHTNQRNLAAVMSRLPNLSHA